LFYQFISVQYGESPDSYSKEINELESLRASAIHATRDYSGCATLKKYYCQLHFLKSRFPMTEGSPIAVNFSWYDIFSDQVHSWSDIEFEISSVLFNIGALHSEVACADSRTTVDDMKVNITSYSGTLIHSQNIPIFTPESEMLWSKLPVLGGFFYFLFFTSKTPFFPYRSAEDKKFYQKDPFPSTC